MPQNARRKPVMKKSAAKTPSAPVLISGLRKSRANIQGNNPKDRYGLAKVPFSLIPQTAKVFMAMALGNGAQKYGPYNWRVEPVQGRIYLEAAERHLSLLLDGEDFDRDTGIHHGAFVLSTIAIYLDAMVHGTLIDNRPLVGRTGDLVAFFNRKPGEDRTQEMLKNGFVDTIITTPKLNVMSLSAINANLGPTTKRAPVKSRPISKKGNRRARR